MMDRQFSPQVNFVRLCWTSKFYSLIVAHLPCFHKSPKMDALMNRYPNKDSQIAINP